MEKLMKKFGDEELEINQMTRTFGGVASYKTSKTVRCHVTESTWLGLDHETYKTEDSEPDDSETASGTGASGS